MTFRRDHGHYVTTISVSWTSSAYDCIWWIWPTKNRLLLSKILHSLISLHIFFWKRPCHYLTTHQTPSAHPKTSHQQKSTYTNSGKRDVAQETVLRVVMKHLSQLWIANYPMTQLIGGLDWIIEQLLHSLYSILIVTDMTYDIWHTPAIASQQLLITPLVTTTLFISFPPTPEG